MDIDFRILSLVMRPAQIMTGGVDIENQDIYGMLRSSYASQVAFMTEGPSHP